jgi:hypothetical protein
MCRHRAAAAGARKDRQTGSKIVQFLRRERSNAVGSETKVRTVITETGWAQMHETRLGLPEGPVDTNGRSIRGDGEARRRSLAPAKSQSVDGLAQRDIHRVLGARRWIEPVGKSREGGRTSALRRNCPSYGHGAKAYRPLQHVPRRSIQPSCKLPASRNGEPRRVYSGLQCHRPRPAARTVPLRPGFGRRCQRPK